MNENQASSEHAYRIRVRLGICIRGPFHPAVPYSVPGRTIAMSPVEIKVSYPETTQIDGREWRPPPGMSTMLEVEWPNPSKSNAEELALEQWLKYPHFKFQALEAVNLLFSSARLVAPQRIDMQLLRTIGEADVLSCECHLDGKPLGGTKLPIMHWHYTNPMLIGMSGPEGLPIQGQPFENYDPHMASFKLIEHLSGTTRLLERRIIRCFELADHGYYTECLIVVFSILDDEVQVMLKALLAAKGINAKEGEGLLRSIEKERLMRYLGPMLKVISGRSINELWIEARAALEWLNERRNKIMHQGRLADRADALKAIFVVLKALKTLIDSGLVQAELNPSYIINAQEQAKILAPNVAWLSARPGTP